MLNTPKSPFTRAEELLGEAHLNGGHFLAPASCGGPGPDAMETDAEALLLALWPRIRARFPDAEKDDVLPIVWSIVSMGGSIEDLDEALLLLDLIARYRGEVSTVEIREAVRVLGDQADLFLEPWVQGWHQRLTGTLDLPVALWEHHVFLRLSDEGADRMRRRINLPPSIARVPGQDEPDRENRARRPSDTSRSRGPSLS